MLDVDSIIYCMQVKGAVLTLEALMSLHFRVNCCATWGMSLSSGRLLILILQAYTVMSQLDVGWVASFCKDIQVPQVQEKIGLLLDAWSPTHNLLCPITTNLNVMCLQDWQQYHSMHLMTMTIYTQTQGVVACSGLLRSSLQ